MDKEKSIELALGVSLIVNCYLTNGSVGSSLCLLALCLYVSFNRFLDKTKISRDNYKELEETKKQISELKNELKAEVDKLRDENSAVRNYVTGLKMQGNQVRR